MTQIKYTKKDFALEKRLWKIAESGTIQRPDAQALTGDCNMGCASVAEVFSRMTGKDYDENCFID